MKERPDFNQIKSYQDFAQYYWYREELKRICKSLDIDYAGTKLELNYNIEEYFKGNIIRKKKAARKTKKEDGELTLKTGLIECGFCFNRRFRTFFAEQTGVRNFKFNADMAATAKKVKEDNDIAFTLGDMLEVYYGKKVYVKYDKSCLQWNKFVKDFCKDKASIEFKNKLKVASILWNEVRNSTKEKVFTKELLTQFAHKIEQYKT
ncbi:SAP domain-containing protein [Treponema sp. HNW]|uniref:SAP domain-containing protein n=1 Tax=Treponema sp. HNW TaxID=3116654 RepID=UPI003D140CBF